MKKGIVPFLHLNFRWRFDSPNRGFPLFQRPISGRLCLRHRRPCSGRATRLHGQPPRTHPGRNIQRHKQLPDGRRPLDQRQFAERELLQRGKEVRLRLGVAVASEREQCRFDAILQFANDLALSDDVAPVNIEACDDANDWARQLDDLLGFDDALKFSGVGACRRLAPPRGGAGGRLPIAHRRLVSWIPKSPLQLER